MDQTIKAQWTAALRSGEYKQGRAVLARDGKFCCLGVLCDLAVKAGVVTSDAETGYEDGRIAYGQEDAVFGLPAEVREWVGLDVDDPEVEYKREGDDEADEGNLSNLNDGSPSAHRASLTFAEIADLIDAQL